MVRLLFVLESHCLISVRVANLSNITGDDATRSQVRFANIGEVPCRAGELTGSSLEVDGIGDHGVEARSDLRRRRGRRRGMLHVTPAS